MRIPGNFGEKELARALAKGIPIGTPGDFEQKELPRALATGLPRAVALGISFYVFPSATARISRSGAPGGSLASAGWKTRMIYIYIYIEVARNIQVEVVDMCMYEPILVVAVVM